MKYVVWVVVGAFSLWVLYVIAGLGNPWVSVGVVAFVGFIVFVNRATAKRPQKTGQPTEKRRVVSTDIDRWGGSGDGSL
jgi:hypothetical protein